MCGQRTSCTDNPSDQSHYLSILCATFYTAEKVFMFTLYWNDTVTYMLLQTVCFLGISYIQIYLLMIIMHVAGNCSAFILYSLFTVIVCDST